mmetsp:Transcript_34108/g.30880  ORF Transcript_34108/g.30880 Transcript_34108/m.30880 type:complete len:166 (+) Transcript_34108:251-748(+)
MAFDTKNFQTCKLKQPYIESLQVNQMPPNYVNQIHLLFDNQTWQEYVKKVPNATKLFNFYIGFVCGLDHLKDKVKGTSEYYVSTNKKSEDFLGKIEQYAKKYDTKIVDEIKKTKRKNYLILDKLLVVHALLEKVALQHNECNRKPNEEMNLYNKYTDLESLPNEI